MIKVSRNKCSQQLSQRQKAWKEEICRGPVNSSQAWKKLPKSLKQSIKISLREMYSNKCCYCEVIIRSQGHPHIEHFRPKHDPLYHHLCFEYDNLHYCCETCNKNKGTKFDIDLISPTDDEPSDHLYFPIDSEVDVKTARGEITKTIVRLNNEELKRTRTLYLKEVLDKIIEVDMLMQLNPRPKGIIINKIDRLLSLTAPDAEFSLMISNLFVNQETLGVGPM